MAFGHVLVGLVGIVGSIGYAVGFRAWGQRAAHRLANAEPRRNQAMPFRWPRYSDHPLLAKFRIVTAVAGLVAAVVGLIVFAAMGRL